ncbi:hypothetical protein AB0H71_13705 [Nocardia sp. NPDC050697]|uniref:hypothetical protein n=1 Tax=Nocardia sp. NPDC050697 TaxID=3155158 RepID=UPI0033F82217
MFSAGETVTVIRSGERDRVGDRVTTASFEVHNCAIAQKSSADNNGDLATAVDSRQSAVTVIELLCPPGSDIRHGDKVRVHGVTYLVDGLPWTPHSPFTAWEPGLVVRLRGVS